MTLTFLLVFYTLVPTGKSICQMVSNSQIWIKYILIKFLLLGILAVYYAQLLLLKIFQPILIPMFYWPRFFWSLFGPSSSGHSLPEILFSTFAPPKVLQQEKYSQSLQDKQHRIYLDQFYIHSTFQISSQSAHLAQKPNQVLHQAMYDAEQPIHDPLCIIMLYNNMVSHIPELPNGFTLNAISFIVITVLYLFFLSYGIMRLNYRKLSTFFKSRQNKIVSNTTANRQGREKRRQGRHTKTGRPKRHSLPKHHIKMFTTTMSLLSTAKASTS